LINIFLLLLIIPLDLSIAKKCIFSTKYEIHVINKLPSGSPQLQIHCASKDDDLGYNNVAIDEDFNWSFCETWFDRTLFFCHFWWGSQNKAFNVFDNAYYCVKYDGANINVLNYCKWEVRPDGFYLEQFNATHPSYYMDRYTGWS
ncbi:hypothetical protein A4A49_63175, partial [Nicotiana attenuata]